MNVLAMKDQDLRGKRVLIREDLNVPVKDGRITSEARLQASLPTIQMARDSGACVILLSHLGRPVEGEFSQKDSLAPVASRLSELLGSPVRLAANYLGGLDVAPGEVVLCENVRFNPGEKKDSEELGRQYAALCDIFVMDAFGTAHRAQASTHAVAKFASVACAGPLLLQELRALEKAMLKPERPFVAILGGSKVSTKLNILNTLCGMVDTLIVGGGIANNIIKAAGYEVGRSLYEPDLMAEAVLLLQRSKEGGATIPVPEDVVVTTALSDESPAVIKAVGDVGLDDMIVDIGPKTAARYAALLAVAKTVIWNGPVGVFEIDQFGAGTEVIAKSIAASSAFSIAGGGDTLAALSKYGVSQNISYRSTGGGAFLEFVEGKKLPAVTMLEKRCNS